MINIENIFENIQKFVGESRDILKYETFEAIYGYFSKINVIYIEEEIIPTIKKYFSDSINMEKFKISLRIYTINNVNLSGKKIPNLINLDEIMDFLENDFNFKQESCIYSDNNIDSDILKYSYILKIFYIFWHKKIEYDHLITTSTEQITNKYGDLYKHNSNFNSYNLLPFDREKFDLNPINKRLTDTNGNYFNLDYLSVYFMKYIKELITENYIKDISFRVPNNNSTKLNKAKTTGSSFHMNIKEIKNLSIFNDFILEENGMDQLIIKHVREKQEITFEEIVSDYIDFQDDFILTQVIHLKYFSDEKNAFFIEHIDHEYIKYSYEQYDKKIKNPANTKGENKFKTFKIDNSNIPLSYKNQDGQYFLYIVLLSFFDNKNILSEYFFNVIDF